MIIAPLSLDGAYLIQPERKTDERGYFARSFCKTEFHEAGLETEFPQHSLSFNIEAGTLRGLHYQNAPFDEVKVVRCSRGRIHDVIVDLRHNSATFGRWLAFELNAENGLSLYIPGGFAHGFITLAPASEIHYMISKNHIAGQGRVLRWNDPELSIDWPIQPLVMSSGDRHAPGLLESISGKGSKADA